MRLLLSALLCVCLHPAALAAIDSAWQPTVNFADGLRDTIAWYLNNKPWVSGVTSGNYRRERLGLGVGA